MATRCDIVIQALPDDSVPVLRAIRTILGYGLKDAKEVVEYARSNCPCTLFAGIPEAAATKMAQTLRSADVVIAINPSTITHPMLICPRLDDRYESHWLFGLRQIEQDS